MTVTALEAARTAPPGPGPSAAVQPCAARRVAQAPNGPLDLVDLAATFASAPGSPSYVLGQRRVARQPRSGRVAGLLHHLGDDDRPDHRGRAGRARVTTEYGTGRVRSSFAAVPSRGRVIAAKAIVVTGVLFVVGTLTALVGYVGGNYFLDREGIGMALEGDVLRAMYGSGLYLAGIGLFTVAVGLPAPAHRRHDLDRPGPDADPRQHGDAGARLVRRLAGEADARQRRLRDRHPGLVQPEPARAPGPASVSSPSRSPSCSGSPGRWCAAATPDPRGNPNRPRAARRPGGVHMGCAKFTG